MLVLAFLALAGCAPRSAPPSSAVAPSADARGAGSSPRPDDDANPRPPEYDPAEVKATVRRNLGQLTYCYEEALRLDPTTGGRIELSWWVDAGRVTEVQVDQNTTGDEAFARCLADRIAAWAFPETMDGGLAEAFVFIPKQ